MAYESNTDQIVINVTGKMKNLTANMDKLQREIALTLTATNRRRIHNQGQDANERPITRITGTTGARSGRYSTSHAKRRQRRGRQTSVVDLSFTGKLDKETNARAVSGGWGVGAVTRYAGNLMRWHTENYGRVWGISKSDRPIIDKIIERYVRQQLG